LYFTGIKYKDIILNTSSKKQLNELVNKKILLVTGIANPNPLQDYLSLKNINYEHLKYKDHHHFSEKELHNIEVKAKTLNTEEPLILTTEKDYVRSFIGLKNVFYLPIEVVFLQDAKDFNNEIIDYVGQSTTNG